MEKCPELGSAFPELMVGGRCREVLAIVEEFRADLAEVRGRVRLASAVGTLCEEHFLLMVVNVFDLLHVFDVPAQAFRGC